MILFIAKCLLVVAGIGTVVWVVAACEAVRDFLKNFKEDDL